MGCKKKSITGKTENQHARKEQKLNRSNCKVQLSVCAMFANDNLRVARKDDCRDSLTSALLR